MNHGPLIDTHQHPIPDYYKRALETIGIHGSGENPWADWSVSAQLELMDQTGICGRSQFYCISRRIFRRSRFCSSPGTRVQ